jgi:hypothetical protein
MARHNRDARGTDQRGAEYVISYQPDWLRLIKVTRTLESGRQSTKTLFRNPSPPERSPGGRIRTHLKALRGRLEVEIVLLDAEHAVRRVVLETGAPEGPAGGAVVFTIVGVGAPDEGDED